MIIARPMATPRTKVMYLIKRKATTSREELIAHWFANHMPGTIARQAQSRAAGGPYAQRYFCTLFDPKEGMWDGMAQVWFEQPPPSQDKPHGETPVDTFQEKVEPYCSWSTREYVVMDGALPVVPQTLNAPFPCTRSGFFKVTFLVSLQQGTDCAALFDHWLNVHIPNVRDTMQAVGGFRYVVSHSLTPEQDSHAGMAELYFADATGWARYRERIKADGMEAWVDGDATTVFYSGTELVGIP